MASGDSLLAFDPLANRPPASGYATVDLRGGFVVLDFDDAANETAQFHAILPSHYGGGQLLAVVTWTSTTATTGDVRLRIEATRLAAGDDLDAMPAAGGSSEVTASAPAASGELVVTETAALSAGGAVAGDLLLVGLKRLATDAADTLVGDVEIVSLEIREA